MRIHGQLSVPAWCHDRRGQFWIISQLPANDRFRQARSRVPRAKVVHILGFRPDGNMCPSGTAQGGLAVAGVNYFFLRVASPRNVTRLPHAVCYRISIRLQSHINLILAPVRRRSRRAVSAAQGRGEVRHTRVFRLSDSLDDLVGSHGAISAVACSWPLVWLASAVDRSQINACERASRPATTAPL